VNTWNSKKDCRSFFKTLCAQNFERGLVQNQQQLDFQLASFLKSQTGTWGAYRALPREAGVEVFSTVPNLKWVFPRMKDGRLEFCQPTSFVEGPFGVREPAPDSMAVDLSKVQGLLIPGLAFNKNGTRLGKGLGFYDKSLENFSGLKVGVCFDFQLVESSLPHEAHDIQVDWIVTESGAIECEQQRQ
jgi:5-formyltetrahydrofolate cyclo-ligase